MKVLVVAIILRNKYLRGYLLKMLKNDATLLTRAFFCCIFALTKTKFINLKQTNNEMQSTMENSIGYSDVNVRENECSANRGVWAVSQNSRQSD